MVHARGQRTSTALLDYRLYSLYDAAPRLPLQLNARIYFVARLGKNLVSRLILTRC